MPPPVRQATGLLELFIFGVLLEQTFNFSTLDELVLLENAQNFVSSELRSSDMLSQWREKAN